MDEDLSWGLTDGWWRFADIKLRANHPLLQVNQWTLLFEGGSYTGNAHATNNCAMAGQSVLVAFKTHDPIKMQYHADRCAIAINSSQYTTGGVGGLGLVMACLLV